MKINRLIRLVEREAKNLPIHSEYWYTGRELEEVSEEYDHSSIALQVIINHLTDLLGIENKYDTDLTWFRSDLADDELGVDYDQFYDLVEKEYGKRWREDLSRVSRGEMDPRVFAINHFNWIRISRNSVEVKDLTSATLRRVGGALLAALEEEGTDPEEVMDSLVWVGKYDGQNQATTINLLLDGKIKGDLQSYGEIAKRSMASLDSMDREQMHSYYSRIGD